ncbi:MAG: alanine--tRNA ligase-related protein, partial [Candidatus Woesearchaeota archaeon]
IENAIKQKKLGREELVQLYDSHGIDPQQVKEAALQQGIQVSIPDDFYALVAQRHEHTNVLQTKKEIPFATEGLSPTELLYYTDYLLTEFSARVVSIQGTMVALDKTAFYPTSGGQIHDLGTLQGIAVIDVIKKEGVVVHVLAQQPTFPVGSIVKGSIDRQRRIQVAQHHTGAHILNAAARAVLGNHVYQAGAAKTPEKARLDITHYDLLSSKQLLAIEAAANALIKQAIPVEKEIIPREVAEERYGMRIYQGGFVPGKNLRIVRIGDHDIEACGGTHLNNTSEAILFRIIGTTKVQDGVIRINYVCGQRALTYTQEEEALLTRLCAYLGNDDKFMIPALATTLFEHWKEAKKCATKGERVPRSLLRLSAPASERYEQNDILAKTSEILSTQQEHLEKTVLKFKQQLEEWCRSEI